MDLVQQLRGRRIDLDVATNGPEDTVCPSWISRRDVAPVYRFLVQAQGYEAWMDGLSTPWFGEHVWCNPPFAQILPWVKHAIEEVQLGHAGMVTMCLPASVSSKWFKLGLEHGEVVLLRPRVQFWHPEEPGNRPMGDTCLLLLGDETAVGDINLIDWRDEMEKVA